MSKKHLYNSVQVKNNIEIVFKQLAEYAYKFKNHNDIDKMIRGELYTLIRRHISTLVNTQVGFTSKNIDSLYFDQTKGEILYLRFVKHYGGCYDDYIIDELNKEVIKLNNNFGNYLLTTKLSNITNNVNNFKFK